MTKLPKPGDTIYFPSVGYVYRGRDDFKGGKVTVKKVTKDYNEVHFVEIFERPGHKTRWENYLREMQKELAAVWKEERGGPDPDLRAEFNTSWSR